MCLVFVRLGKVNASVRVPVLIIDHCVSLDFSVVQQNSPICVRQFFSFSMKQHCVRCMECPQVADGDAIWLSEVAANILKSGRGQPTRSSPPACGCMWGYNTSKKMNLL
jgi:hypothetical protein